MTNKELREAFETGIADNALKVKNDDGGYAFPGIEQQWQGFQAGAAHAAEETKALEKRVAELKRFALMVAVESVQPLLRVEAHKLVIKHTLKKGG